MKSQKSPRKKTCALGRVKKDHRGFELIQFKDHYGSPSSLQASSLAIYVKPGTSAVWLGIDECEPKILATDAKALGIPTEKDHGWIPYEIPQQVSLITRMHLNREQVAALIEHLSNWLEHDSFNSESSNRVNHEKKTAKTDFLRQKVMKRLQGL